MFRGCDKQLGQNACTVRLYVYGLALYVVGVLCLRYYGAYIRAATLEYPTAFWGEHIIPSFGALLVTVIPLALVVRWVLASHANIAEILLFILASIVSLQHFHITDNMLYTNDLYGHLARIHHTGHHWLEPFSYDGWQRHHPPVYYYVAAAIVWCTQQIGNLPDLLALRYFSWICFLWFCAYSLRILYRAGFQGRLRVVCAALLLFWPAGLQMASKISNEPLFFALYAASFYHLLCWYQRNDTQSFHWGIALAAVAFSVRTGAIMLVGVAGILFLLMLWQRRFLWHQLVGWRGMWVAVVVVICIIGNLAHLVHGMNYEQYMGYMEGEEIKGFSHYVTVQTDVIFNHAVNYVDRTDLSYWDMILRTAVAQEYWWPDQDMVGVMWLQLLLLVAFTLCAVLFMKWNVIRDQVPYVAGLLLPIVMNIVYTLENPVKFSSDARYIYPALVCFIIVFGRGCEVLNARRLRALAWAGQVLAVSFCCVAAYFYCTYSR